VQNTAVPASCLQAGNVLCSSLEGYDDYVHHEIEAYAAKAP